MSAQEKKLGSSTLYSFHAWGGMQVSLVWFAATLFTLEKSSLDTVISKDEGRNSTQTVGTTSHPKTKMAYRKCNLHIASKGMYFCVLMFMK